MRVLLIGNYAPDRQESMLRYAQMMREGLEEAGHQVTLATPQPVLNASGRPATGVWKWVGYLDKFVLSPADLAQARRRADVVHVCDHSNALYVPARPPKPYVVTCHDLLAVRGALGEATDCPASFTGRYLQRLVVRGLRRAHAVACVSAATLRDAQRLLGDYAGKLVVTRNSLNYAYRRLSPGEVRQRLTRIGHLDPSRPYVLTVGSNLRRKNRETVVRAAGEIASRWNGQIVMAGEPSSPGLRALAARLGIGDRIVDIPSPSNELLEALYNGALALLFPSRFEGFGWPVIEAQACGCPVICSSADPLPEIAGAGAIFCDPDDSAAFGRAILDLAGDPSHRDAAIQAGLANAATYGRRAMIERFVALYAQVAGAT